jgi:hypothetical protein
VVGPCAGVPDGGLCSGSGGDDAVGSVVCAADYGATDVGDRADGSELVEPADFREVCCASRSCSLTINSGSARWRLISKNTAPAVPLGIPALGIGKRSPRITFPTVVAAMS